MQKLRVETRPQALKLKCGQCACTRDYTLAWAYNTHLHFITRCSNNYFFAYRPWICPNPWIDWLIDLLSLPGWRWGWATRATEITDMRQRVNVCSEVWRGIRTVSTKVCHSHLESFGDHWTTGQIWYSKSYCKLLNGNVIANNWIWFCYRANDEKTKKCMCRFFIAVGQCMSRMWNCAILTNI